MSQGPGERRAPLVPVIELGGILLVSIRGELTDAEALALREDVTGHVARSGAGGVVLDISALDVVDSYLARVVAEVAASCRLLAARAILVGMRPEVALTLVELGLTLPDLETARTADDAATRLGLRIERAGRRGSRNLS